MNIVYIDVYLIETVSILTHLANIDIIAKESSMDSYGFACEENNPFVFISILCYHSKYLLGHYLLYIMEALLGGGGGV